MVGFSPFIWVDDVSEVVEFSVFIARFMLPTAKKMLTETVKATSKVIDSIVNKKQLAKSAVLHGLKTAGTNTA